MKAWLIPIALIAGATNAVEAGTNTALRKGFEAPVWSVAIISLLTLVCACATAGIIGERIPTFAAVAAVPWWGWIGGALGFGFVMAMVFTAEPLGAALFIALTVSASTICSIALDHFGWVGFEQHAAGTGGLIGGLLIIIGVALIAKF